MSSDTHSESPERSFRHQAKGGRDMPRLLVISEDALSKANGTGVLFSRSFGFYPNDRIANWYIKGNTDLLVEPATDFSATRWSRSPTMIPSTLCAKAWNFIVGRPHWPMPVNVRALSRAASVQVFKPDVVYAVVYSREGIDSLNGLLAGLPRRIPVLLHVQDFFPTSGVGFFRALRRLAPRISEAWAVSEAIVHKLQREVPQLRVRFDPPFHCDMPVFRKTRHGEAGPEFRSVLLGNFWNPGLVPEVRKLWADMQRSLPGLPPLSWYCHPNGRERVRAAGIELGGEIVPCPYLSDDRLCSVLAESDLAIVPFQGPRSPSTDYERYSMPSRLTEICAVGLPFVCLAGPGTPPHEYLSKHGVGICLDPTCPERCTQDLLRLLRDTQLRSRLGDASRRHAEDHFRLDVFQTFLAEKIAALAAQTSNSN